ncbi:MAG: LysM peptidoglycan-binding domain-containing protein [Gammaproteobacteria bacterium]
MRNYRYSQAIMLTVLLVSGLLACTPFAPDNAQSFSTKRLLASNNLWDHFRHDARLPDANQQPQVQEAIQRYLKNPQALQHVISNATPYMYYIYQEVHKRDMPIEVILQPIVESSYNPFAYSSVGAAGLWQIMPGTASGYDIEQNWWYDGRRDIFASTNAALDHLNYLRHFFDNNLLLALAAYDAGRGKVQYAIKKNKAEGKSTEFWALDLPRETQYYIPRLLALAEIIKHPKKYHFDIPFIAYTPYLAKVKIGSQIDLFQAAKLANISVREIYQLNPGFNRWATAPNGPHTLVLPIEKVDAFQEQLKKIPTYKRVTWEHYRVQKGDSLGLLAHRFNTSVQLLKQINKLSSNTIRINQELLLPTNIKSLSKNQSIKTTLPFLKIPHNRGPKKITYKVKKGDTIARIARHYNLKSSEIRYWNRLKYQSKLEPGTELVLWKPRKHYRAGNHYKVKSGDSLWKIAQKYHTSVNQLAHKNRIDSHHPLRVGQIIVI